MGITAGFWVRALSLLIDVITLGLLGGAIGFLFPTTYLILIFLVFVMQVIYFVGMTYVFGATVGKMLTGCLVVGSDGQRLTLSRAFIRETVKIGPLIVANAIYYAFKSERMLSIALVYSAIVISTMIFSKSKRGLHDKLAKASVVKKRLCDVNKSLFPKFNNKLAEKFALGGGIVLIAIQILGKGFTNSRLFNALIGVLCGGLGAILGTFVYYVKLRFLQKD